MEQEVECTKPTLSKSEAKDFPVPEEMFLKLNHDSNLSFESNSIELKYAKLYLQFVSIKNIK